MNKLKTFTEWLNENHEMNVLCSNCGQTFMGKMEGKINCPQCGGATGEDAANFGDHGWHPCYHCSESGKVDGTKCPHCGIS